MNKLFSVSAQRLYRSDWKSDYESAGDWPNDLINVTDEQASDILKGLNKGAHISISGKEIVSSGGKPDTSLEDFLEYAKTELRAIRSPMLDALSGIAGRATRSGNDALASEADELAEQLLDITDDHALNSAMDFDSMKAAGVAAYKRIAAEASPALSIVFKEITGA